MLSRLLDLLAPPECAACQRPVAHARAFCPACASTVQRHRGAGPRSIPTHAAFLYGGALATAILRWKFERALGVGTQLSGLFVAETAREVAAGALLVPVPLHPRRLAERGFNPAALLAAALARRSGARFVPDLLRRVRDTPKQSLLGRHERASNVAAAFAATASPSAPVVLIDDVCTTGATLCACRAALLLAGAPWVSAAVLAWAPGADPSPPAEFTNASSGKVRSP